MKTTSPFVSLKSNKTIKIGQRTEGYLHYRVLADQSGKLYFNITGNDDNGYYSKEVIPFEAVEQIVKGIKPNVPIPSNVFKKAFVGQSNNNAAFLAAILRAEKLLSPMADAVKKHTVTPDWDKWKSEMLKQVSKAKPFEPELAKPLNSTPSKKPANLISKSDMGTTEIDDTEFELLQPK